MKGPFLAAVIVALVFSGAVSGIKSEAKQAAQMIHVAFYGESR